MEPKSGMLGEVLELTGLSTRNMARLVGLHHSALLRFEKNTGDIPFKPFHTIGTMNVTLSAIPTPVQPQLTENQKKKLKSQAEYCMARCYPLQNKLVAMQKRYAQLLLLLAWLQQVTEIVPGEPISERQQRWIDSAKYDAEEKLPLCDAAAQLKVSLAIALLEKEAEVCSKVAREENELNQ